MLRGGGSSGLGQSLLLAFGLLWGGGLHALAADEADLRDGKRVFRTQCLGCHSVEAGENRAGPSLAGLFGREAGTLSGYNFSQAMKDADILWSPETLDEFLQGPNELVPGTKMVLWPLEERPRRQVITYLKSLAE